MGRVDRGLIDDDGMLNSYVQSGARIQAHGHSAVGGVATDDGGVSTIQGDGVVAMGVAKVAIIVNGVGIERERDVAVKVIGKSIAIVHQAKCGPAKGKDQKGVSRR